MEIEEAILLFNRYVYGKELKKDDLVDIVNIIISAYKKEKEKIKKAIEYIGIDDELKKCCDVFDVNGIEILKILEGGNKNEKERYICNNN